ncbi:RNA polymerase sigma factor [Emticicia sp. W12TSBA100-4]|uniref:RNA polymerase sigma factor n=1 Tax=Emticicia sp. W12TSBA100-4 TaxID=3160965 RepID=UPI0033056E86
MENPFSINNYKDSIDIQLIESALLGNKNALNDLLKRHQNFIYNVALKMLNNIADAEDVTQEILIKIITQLSKYDKTKAQFRTWLYRITFNHVLNMKKNNYESMMMNFDSFFGVIDAAPDIEVSANDELELAEAFEESKVACMAGMLMCLDRMQRLVYIVGEVFEIDHRLAAEIFEISPDNFRQKLSRVRKDLYQWMHNRCGLVNLENPCRCKSKTKGFIELGYVDPKNLKWMSNYKHRMYEFSAKKIDEAWNARDKVYQKLYQEHPFKTSLKADEILNTIIEERPFNEFLGMN